MLPVHGLMTIAIQKQSYILYWPENGAFTRGGWRRLRPQLCARIVAGMSGSLSDGLQ